MPTGNVDIIINLAEDELRTYNDHGELRRHPAAVLSGPATYARIIDSDETNNLLTVTFRHGAAYPFLRGSLDELTDAMVDLGDLFGREGATVRERVLEAPAIADKVAIVEAMLLTRTPSESERNQAVALGLAALDRGDSVHKVARDLEVSPKRLVSLFQKHTGMTPKRFSRIRRLQRVLRSVHGRSDPEWATVAAEHGYFDQSHLIRDFRELTGMTPTTYEDGATGEQNHVAFVQSIDSQAP